MTQTNDRIEQFRKMAEDDPDNELGHFSLGRAYLEAQMPDQAAGALKRALQINPKISKAYQLLADAQLALNQRDQAIESLNQGLKIAHERGDMLPKNAMLAKLQELGAPAPDLGAAVHPQQEVGEGQVLCKRCGRVNPRMMRQPFKSEFGREIYEKICAHCWKEAIAMGTKVINELRLLLTDPQAQKVWDVHIREFLGL